MDERDRLWEYQAHSSPTWVFQLPEVVAWLDSPALASNTIWLSATTGFGKSAIASYLSKELVVKFPSAVVTYFFCRDKEALRHPHQIVRVILSELCSASSAASETAQQIWKTDMSMRDLSADTFNKLLIPTLQALDLQRTSRVFIIIDGLNELPKESLSRILKLLQQFQSLHQRSDMPSLRILLASQPIGTRQNELCDVMKVPLPATT